MERYTGGSRLTCSSICVFLICTQHTSQINSVSKCLAPPMIGPVPHTQDFPRLNQRCQSGLGYSPEGAVCYLEGRCISTACCKVDISKLSHRVLPSHPMHPVIAHSFILDHSLPPYINPLFVPRCARAARRAGERLG